MKSSIIYTKFSEWSFIHKFWLFRLLVSTWWLTDSFVTNLCSHKISLKIVAQYFCDCCLLTTFALYVIGLFHPVNLLALSPFLSSFAIYLHMALLRSYALNRFTLTPLIQYRQTSLIVSLSVLIEVNYLVKMYLSFKIPQICTSSCLNFIISNEPIYFINFTY